METTATTITVFLVTAASLAVLLIYALLKIQSIFFQLESAEKEISSYGDCSRIRQQLYGAILAIQTPEAVARIAVNYLWGLSSWESVSVSSYDLDEQTAFLLSSRHESEPLPDSTDIKDVHGIDTLTNGKVFKEIQNMSSPHLKLYSLKIPLLSGATLIGSIDIMSKNADIDHHLSPMEELAGPLTIAIQNARLFTSVEKQQNQLRSLSARLTEMEEAERKNIAIELHDRVGQNLSALNINLNIIKSRMRGGLIDSAEICFSDSFLLIEKTTEQIRDIMSDLRPPNLDDHGLIAALRWHAAQQTKRTGLKIEIEGNSSAPRQPLEIEMVFFRIAQEALNNIIKHAKAHAAKISVEQEDGRIRMIIRDDGIGFDTERIINHHRVHPGLGLIAMNERVSALGGTFSIESVMGKGTQVIIEV